MSEEAIPAESVGSGPRADASSPEAAAPADERPGRHAFRVGDGGPNLLIPQGTVCEVMDIPPIARVPNTASWLLGLANLRGTVVPVFDLARVFGLSGAPGPDARLLVIDEGEMAAGVIIDGLPSLQRFSPEERAESPDGLPVRLRRCATGCFAHAGDHWIEFAHVRLFGALAEEVALR